MNFFHFSLGFLSSGLLGFYFTKNNLDPWMWARWLRESASLSLHLELTAPLNPPTLTPPRAPELECS
jgi:hypothetical protein